MKKIDYMAVAGEAISQIKKKGAFLTVKAGETLNTMAIGWATFGYVWKQPILMVAEECNLELKDAREVFSPIISAPGLHFECKIVFKAAMDPEHLAEEYENLYSRKDYHTLYFGEIQDCYEIE
jgi:flavin reductase (DIM6/NTAB) family NADH-FMN oxidoreductase RutF